jgi:hypothetical protein
MITEGLKRVTARVDELVEEKRIEEAIAFAEENGLHDLAKKLEGLDEKWAKPTVQELVGPNGQEYLYYPARDCWYFVKPDKSRERIFKPRARNIFYPNYNL